jgi:hypothetical protein
MASPEQDLIIRCFLSVVLSMSVAILCFSQSSPLETSGSYMDLAGGGLYEECGSGSAVVLLHDGLLHSALGRHLAGVVRQESCGRL